MQNSDSTRYGAYGGSSSNGGSYLYTVPAERTIISSVQNGTGSPRPKRYNHFGYLKYKYVYGRGGSFRTWVDGNGDVQTSQDYGVTNQVSPPDGFVGTHPGVYYAELSDQCMAGIYEQIRGQGNLIVDLAESHQTLKMLKATLSLRKVVKTFFDELIIPRKWSQPKGRFRTQTLERSRGDDALRQRLDYMTDKWLEYRYGWQPLIYSIYDCATTLTGKHFLNRQYPVTEKASRRFVNVAKSPTQGGQIVTTEFTNVRMLTTCVFNIGYTNPVMDFTSLNPLGIAFELMPLSFVADWVVNISGTLQAWENHVLFADRFVEGFRSYSHLVTRGRRATFADYVPIMPDPERPGKNLPNPIGQHFRFEDSSFYEKEFRRSPLSSLPRPGGIRVQPYFNAKRQLDAAALLHNLVAKRFR